MDAAAAASAAAAAGGAACMEAADADGGAAAAPLDATQAPGSAQRVGSVEALEPSPAPEEEKPLAKPAKGKAGRKCVPLPKPKP